MRLPALFVVLAAFFISCGSADDADPASSDVDGGDVGDCVGSCVDTRVDAATDGAPGADADPGDTVTPADGDPTGDAPSEDGVDSVFIDVVEDIDEEVVEDVGGEVVEDVADGTPEDVQDLESIDAGPPPISSEDWYTVFGGSASEEIKCVTADSDGNVYVAGTFSEGMVIGTETFTPVEPGTNTPDSFVASFDASGTFRWAHAFTASLPDIPYEIAVDGQDRVYVLGSHQADLTIGDELLGANGGGDVYLASFDQEGNQLWAKSWGGPYGESPRDLSVNPAGDIFITGSFQGYMEADELSVGDPESLGLSEVFVLAVDGQTHDPLWLRGFTGMGHDVGTAIVADQNRSTVTAVSYYNDLTIDPVEGITFDAGDNFDVGLVRLDEDGNVLWANGYGGSGSEEIIGLDLDTFGNIHMTGVFSDTVSFGGADLVGTGGHDIVVASYASNGDHLWSWGYTGGSFDQTLDLEVVGDAIYVAGRYREDLQIGDSLLDSVAGGYDLLVARFETTDGTPVWIKSLGSTGDDQANGIGVGGDGGIYVGGYVDGALSFDGETQPLAGTGKDAFVFRLVD